MGGKRLEVVALGREKRQGKVFKVVRKSCLRREKRQGKVIKVIRKSCLAREEGAEDHTRGRGKESGWGWLLGKGRGGRLVGHPPISSTTCTPLMCECHTHNR